MEYILYFVRLLIVAMSLGGIALFFYDRFKIDAAFTPITAISSVTVVVYLFGVVGLLVQSVYAVYAVGIALFVITAVRVIRGKVDIKPFLSPAMALFLLLCVYFIVRMPGVYFKHTDNYSHWGTIIKEMFYFDRYPDENTVITFRNYAPGSATFVYFICKIVGWTEGFGLMAQGLILSASLTAVLARAKWKDHGTTAALAVVSVASLAMLTVSSASLHIYNFLVDGLIAFVTVAAGVVVYAYRHEPKRSFIAAFPVLAFLSIIKSSARFFVILIGIMALVFFLERIKSIDGKKPRLIYAAGAVGVSASFIAVQSVMNSVWDIYTKYAYPSITEGDNKFDTSLDGLISYFTDKDGEYIAEMSDKVWGALTDLSSTSVRAVIIAEIFAALVIVLVFALGKKPRTLVTAFGAANAAGAFYIAELYVLYLYIFDESEATILASFYRYYATGAILVSLVLMAAGIYQLTMITDKRRRIALFAAALIVSGLFVYNVRDNAAELFNDAQASITRRDMFIEASAETSKYIPRDSYVIAYVKTSDFHARSCLVYELLTNDYRVMDRTVLTHDDRIRDLLGRADYLIVYEDSWTFWESLRKLGYDMPIGGTKSLVYEVTQTADGGFVMTACE